MQQIIWIFLALVPEYFFPMKKMIVPVIMVRTTIPPNTSNIHFRFSGKNSNV